MNFVFLYEILFFSLSLHFTLLTVYFPFNIVSRSFVLAWKIPILIQWNWFSPFFHSVRIFFSLSLNYNQHIQDEFTSSQKKKKIKANRHTLYKVDYTNYFEYKFNELVYGIPFVHAQIQWQMGERANESND